jgi:hypothetical protein
VSADDRSDLETLFAPPLGSTGTQLLMCGLSADAETLERVMAAFTNEPPAQRKASGLVRGLLLLDASVPQHEAQPAPGWLRLASCMKEEWQRRTTLLHAKVALMGFGPSRSGVPDCWRLIVCTGNWTGATWERNEQIDLYWTSEWNAKAGPDADDGQPLADAHAALAFFERIIRGLFQESHSALDGIPLAAGWLEIWKRNLTLRGRARGRLPSLVHSLDDSLMAVIQQRFSESRPSTLLVGSGFFEQGGGAMGATPEVLQQLEQLGGSSGRYLVFNPECAGALAHWIPEAIKRAKGKDARAASRVGNWYLCLPRDPLEKKAGMGRKFLHAKFVAGLHGVRDEDETAKLVFMYLGSGNLSRRGLLTRARVESRSAAATGSIGNVEAGVALLPDHRIDRIWQRFACGDYASSAAMKSAVPGEGDQLFLPLDPPPVLFLRECNRELQVIRSGAVPTMLWFSDGDGQWVPVSPDQTRVPLGGLPYPPSLRVRTENPHKGEGGTVWEVPVLSSDGLFCRRAAPQLTMDGVLEALTAFPDAPPEEGEDDGSESSASLGGAPAKRPTGYPLRTLAVLLETIAHRNALITPEEFPYWLAQLRSVLTVQAAAEERASIGALEVDLFGALVQPGFVPPWLPQYPELERGYLALVQEIRSSWCGSTTTTRNAGNEQGDKS